MIGRLIKNICISMCFVIGVYSSLEICPSNVKLIHLELINLDNTDNTDNIKYSITTLKNNIIKDGTFNNINIIRTQDLCLPYDKYSIQINTPVKKIKVNKNIGLIICNQHFISMGETIYFENTKNGCIIHNQYINSIQHILQNPPLFMKHVHNPIYSYNSAIFS